MSIQMGAITLLQRVLDSLGYKTVLDFITISYIAYRDYNAYTITTGPSIPSSISIIHQASTHTSISTISSSWHPAQRGDSQTANAKPTAPPPSVHPLNTRQLYQHQLVMTAANPTGPTIAAHARVAGTRPGGWYCDVRRGLRVRTNLKYSTRSTTTALTATPGGCQMNQ